MGEHGVLSSSPKFILSIQIFISSFKAHRKRPTPHFERHFRNERSGRLRAVRPIVDRRSRRTQQQKSKSGERRRTVPRTF
ncbi:hypothetical protein L596_025762 [Steinernema carpocapsae]|uniref:Uncharacterized protein n=1 Tax=Steinernema carpocapsae TaxID=34508 RepID=A0A4U5M8S0_STECR|nr:hypothetical protein L596_025762 [Steinernema carpocapsae]